MMKEMDPIVALIKEIDNQQLWTDEILLSRNEYLIVKGKIDTNLYLVIEGALRIYELDEYEEQTIRFVYKDNLTAAQNPLTRENPS